MRSVKSKFGIRVVAFAITATLAGGGWVAYAQGQRGMQGKEGHPLLERAIDQIGNIKSRLQSAPKDFGGHKQKAIDALSLAADELRQAKQFDNK